MLYTPDRINRLRRRAAAIPSLALRLERLRVRGTALLESPFIPESSARSGAGQHANYYEPAHKLVELVETLGLLHRLEASTTFAARIKDALLFYADYSTWCAPHFLKNSPPWRSELVTGFFTYAYALGHDLLRDEISPEDKAHIAGALITKGVRPILDDWLLPATRIHALDSMGHNWWMVCLAFAGLGALSVLNDHPQAPTWLDALERSIPLWFDYQGNLLQNKPANFDTNGAFYEGLGYCDFALREYLLYRLALTDTCPARAPASHPLLARLEPFFLHSLYPTSTGFLTVNFGDHDITHAGAATFRLLLANNLASPAAAWYVSRTTTDPDHPLAILLDTDPSPRPSLATAAHFPGASWAVLRNSWEDDATLLATRAGTFWNHAHADSASFLLFHKGKPLVVDSGKVAYGRKEYVDHYVGSRAHNVVLVDGEGVPRDDFMRGSTFAGKVHSVFDDGNLKYACADATGPLARLLARHYRHFLWLGDAILIFDDLLAHQPANFQWLLHHAGDAHPAGSTSVTLRNFPAEARLQFLFPKSLALHQPSAPAPDNPDATATYLEFATTTPSRQQNFLAALTLDAALTIEPIEAADLLGARIRTAETITDVYFNLVADTRRMHQNANASFDGWDTDAYLLALTRPAGAPADQVTRLLAINASYLRRDAAVVLDSLSKVDALVTTDPAPRITVHGQPMIKLTCALAGETFHYTR